MQEIYKSNKKEEKESSSFSPFFFRSPIVDIFAAFLAFDEELNEVAQVLGDVVACLLPPPPDQVLPQQGLAHAPTTLNL